MWQYPISPPPPNTSSSSKSFLFTAGDQLVVPIGASHISSSLQEIQSREWKQKRTNEQYAWVNSSAEGELCNIAFPLCICRLTLAWISSEIFTKLLGMPTHLDCSSLTDSWTLSHADWSLCCPVSTGHSRHPSPTPSSQSLCLTLWLAFPSYFGHVEISSPNPLSGFAPIQTKGSSAWRTTYIVLQLFSSI